MMQSSLVYTIYCVPERRQKGTTDEEYDAGGQVFDEGEGSGVKN